MSWNVGSVPHPTKRQLRQIASHAERERDQIARWLSGTDGIKLDEARQRIAAAPPEQREAWREGARLAGVRRRELADV